MSNHQTANDGSAATPLNLRKFAHALAGDGQSDVPLNEGQTLFIKRSATESLAKACETGDLRKDEFGLPVNVMLGIITYCYVRGVFSSKEIAERLKCEPDLRKTFGRDLPNEDEVKSFRRQFATEIEDLLETVYRVFPPEEAAASNHPGVSQTEMLHREAVERLHSASWEDIMRRHLH
jgi:hypothetical protein